MSPQKTHYGSQNMESTSSDDQAMTSSPDVCKCEKEESEFIQFSGEDSSRKNFMV